MNQQAIRDQLREAIRQHRAGDNEAAQNIVRAILREHPESADAWFAASRIVDDPARQRQLLERALGYDPDHGPSRAALGKLGKPPAKSSGGKGQGRNNLVILAGAGTMLVIVVVVGVLLALGDGPDDAPAAEMPTLLPTATQTPAGPSPTPPPTHTPEPSPTPTVSPTPPPFGQTATVQLFDSQTQQAELYIMGTVAAGP